MICANVPDADIIRHDDEDVRLVSRQCRGADDSSHDQAYQTQGVSGQDLFPELRNHNIAPKYLVIAHFDRRPAVALRLDQLIVEG
jgi:hypothetical protein